MKLKKFKFKKVKSTNDTAIRIIKNSKYKSGMIISDKQIISILSFIKNSWPPDIRKRHDKINLQSKIN